VAATLAEDPKMASQLEKVPQAIETTLAMSQSISQQVVGYRQMERAIMIGRGFNYATAFELALKLQELTYTLVNPYSSADFLHGPLALVEPGFPVIVIAPSGKMIDEMKAVIQKVKKRKADLIGISDHKEILDLVHTPLHLPCTLPEWLSPICAIVPGQLFAMFLAFERGLDLDRPRALEKVTQTQ